MHADENIPGDTKITWKPWRGVGENRVGTLDRFCSELLLLRCRYDSVIVSTSIGVPIPQFRGRFCPYTLLLYCDFALPYPEREREREREREMQA